MKTFEEAVREVSSNVSGSSDQHIEAESRRLLDRAKRGVDLASEIADSEFFDALVEAALGMGDARSVIFTAFMNGLQIGMEMERSETGGVKIP